MKAKCKVWIDEDGDIILRIRAKGSGIELRIPKGDHYITRNDVIPNDSIMGLPRTSVFNELYWLIEANNSIQIGNQSYTRSEIDALIKAGFLTQAQSVVGEE